MKSYKKVLLSGLVGVLFAGTSYAQCNTWNGSPDIKKAKVAHQTYRAALKSENYDMAFKNWKVAYDIAPAADGNRDYHYTDGAAIYAHMFANATDAAKQAEYGKRVNELFDEAIKCYEEGGVKLASCKGDADCINKRIGEVAASKAYTQFYDLDAPYGEILKTLELSLEKSGGELPYYALDIASAVVVYQNQSGLLSTDEAKSWYGKLTSIANKNIALKNDMSDYYAESKVEVDKAFAPLAESFKTYEDKKAEVLAQYDVNSSDPEVMKAAIIALKRINAPADDAALVALESKYKSYANAVNAENAAKRQAAKAAREQSNPERMAIKAKQAGDYATAVAKYDEAIAAAGDNDSKADLYYKKAKVLYSNLSKYGQARTAARKAASLKSGWGKPYMLIGDMYVKSAKSCGDGWNQRLAMIAAVDKYAKARSVDPSLASDASSRISRYSKSLPSKQDAFMRGVQPGGTAKVGCWIGETVKVRFN